MGTKSKIVVAACILILIIATVAFLVCWLLNLPIWADVLIGIGAFALCALTIIGAVKTHKRYKKHKKYKAELAIKRGAGSNNSCDKALHMFHLSEFNPDMWCANGKLVNSLDAHLSGLADDNECGPQSRKTHQMANAYCQMHENNKPVMKEVGNKLRDVGDMMQSAAHTLQQEYEQLEPDHPISTVKLMWASALSGLGTIIPPLSKKADSMIKSMVMESSQSFDNVVANVKARATPLTSAINQKIDQVDAFVEEQKVKGQKIKKAAMDAYDRSGIDSKIEATSNWLIPEATPAALAVAPTVSFAIDTPAEISAPTTAMDDLFGDTIKQQSVEPALDVVENISGPTNAIDDIFAEDTAVNGKSIFEIPSSNEDMLSEAINQKLPDDDDDYSPITTSK